MSRAIARSRARSRRSGASSRWVPCPRGGGCASTSCSSPSPRSAGPSRSRPAPSPPRPAPPTRARPPPRPRTPPAAFASKLLGPGVGAATPVVFKLENAVLTGRYGENHADLAAVDPAGFARVAALADSFFVRQSGAQELARLAADPRGVLV